MATKDPRRKVFGFTKDGLRQRPGAAASLSGTGSSDCFVRGRNICTPPVKQKDVFALRRQFRRELSLLTHSSGEGSILRLDSCGLSVLWKKSLGAVILRSLGDEGSTPQSLRFYGRRSAAKSQCCHPEEPWRRRIFATEPAVLQTAVRSDFPTLSS